jgi:MFS family permease
MLPQTLPLEHLTNAVSWAGGAREMATVAGPALGGWLIAVSGSEAVYIGQAVCAVIAAFCFWRMELPARPVEDQPAPGLKATIEGLRFVWRDKLILSTLSLDMLAVMFGGATALLPIYATEILHVGATGLGWLRAAPAVGAGIMSVYLAHRTSMGAAGKWLLA